MAPPMTSVNFLASISILIVISAVNCIDQTPFRKITVIRNPGCKIPDCQPPNNISLYHISLISANDSIHYLVSNIGLPTILSAKFNNTTPVAVVVDWDKLLSNDTKNVTNSIYFDHKPLYTTSLIFTHLIEYNDVNDTAKLVINNSDVVKLHTFDKFQWEEGDNAYNATSNEIVLRTSGGEEFQPNGSLWFKIRIYNQTGRQDYLPHLQFNSNLTQLDLAIDRFQVNYNNSRFGLNMVMISEDFISQSMPIVTVQSLDDEESPGVFKVMNWRTRLNSTDGNYLQWRPISYTKPDPSIKYGVSVQHNQSNPTVYNPSRTLAWGYYGYNISNIASQAAYVTFGMPNDKFYKETDYIVWSANFGYGTPPTEKFTMFVIILIAIGLGVPFVLIVVGSVVVCVKRRRRETSMYVSIDT